MKTIKNNSLKLSIIVTLASFLFSCSPKSSFTVENKNNESLDSLSPPADLPTSSTIPKPVVPLYVNQLKDLASKSSCAKMNWASRGRSPAGYIKGMAVSYARSVCRLKAIGEPKPGAIIMASVNSNDAKKDVLAHYQDILSTSGLLTNTPGQQPLLATYTIGMGLGMRESSGKFCEGWDVAAGSNRTSAEAEAGLFQVSYDSISASKELSKLYEEYKNNPKKCLLEVFKEGVSCSPRSILGSGDGAKYQEFNLKCPAFATEYAMTLLRLSRSHFGPINKRAAQVSLACDSMLSEVQKIVNQDPEAVCKEIF